MTRNTLLKYLEALHACYEARVWVAAQSGSAAVIWGLCQNSEWMLWLLDTLHAPDDILRHLAADLAQEASQYAGDDEAMAIAWCVDVARRRAKSEVVEGDEIDAAWDAARDATWTANGAAARAAARAAASAAAAASARAYAWAYAGADQCDFIRARVSGRALVAMLRKARKS